MVSVAHALGDELPRISPELVLVDPELSRRVRPRVPILSFRRRRPPLPPLALGVTTIVPPPTELTAPAGS